MFYAATRTDKEGRVWEFIGFSPDGEQKEQLLFHADGTCAKCGVLPTPNEIGCEICTPHAWP